MTKIKHSGKRSAFTHLNIHRGGLPLAPLGLLHLYNRAQITLVLFSKTICVAVAPSMPQGQLLPTAPFIFSTTVPSMEGSRATALMVTWMTSDSSSFPSHKVCPLCPTKPHPRHSSKHFPQHVEEVVPVQWALL